MSDNYTFMKSSIPQDTEFRPYYETNGNFMIWYDFAVIKLSHLFESLDHIGLVRRFDATMR